MAIPRPKLLLLIGLALLTLGLSLAVLALNGEQPAKAETGKKALILSTSVSGGAASAEAVRATNLGFTVTLVDDATWGAMTKDQFADFRLVIVGDPTCGSLRQVVSQNAQALADAVMDNGTANTKAGNRVLVGTDPRFHYGQGGDELIDTAIDFAGVQEGATGLHLSFTCSDPDYNGNGTRDGQELLLPRLTIDPTPGWTQNTSPPCGGSASLISNAAQFSTLSSSDLQGWGCSVHESFPTFPSDWNPLAIATDTPTKPTCGTDVDTGDPECGQAYILIAGSGIVTEAPNLSLTPATAENPVGTTHTVTATVTNPDDSPRSGVNVTFTVTGANAGATGVCNPASCNTGADGKVTFTYTGANAGDDTINASMTIDGSTQSATAAKKWVEGPSGPAGHMTGEGRLTQSASNRLDFAYDRLNCTLAQNGSPKFAGKRNTQVFKVTAITAMSCTDDPTKIPANPAPFDTMEGDGTGTVGSTAVKVHFKFVDGGTAGTNDSSFIEIRRSSDDVVIFTKSEGPIGAYGGGTRPGRNTAYPPPAI